MNHPRVSHHHPSTNSIDDDDDDYYYYDDECGWLGYEKDIVALLLPYT